MSLRVHQCSQTLPPSCALLFTGWSKSCRRHRLNRVGESLTPRADVRPVEFPSTKPSTAAPSTNARPAAESSSTVEGPPLAAAVTLAEYLSYAPLWDISSHSTSPLVARIAPPA